MHPLRGLLGELARNRRVRRLELRRFRRDELAEQLAGLVGEDPPAGLVEESYARSEGNPFFAEELVLAGDGAGRPRCPPAFGRSCSPRVVRLGRDTRQVLAVAAAAGPGTDQPMLAAVAGTSEAELLDGLREAVDQQVLLPEPGGDGYVFRHTLVAEAVYGELLPGERVRLHTALAGALEAGLGAGDAPATRAARIAHHLSAAGDQPRALSASVEAAAAAEQVYAFAEAQLQLERVLALWERVPDAEERAGADLLAVLSRCAEVAYTAGDNTRAVQLARRALPLAGEARQRQRAGLLHEQLARCLRALGDPEALGQQQAAVRPVRPEPSVERARVLGSLAQYLGLVDRFAEARGPAEEAVATAVQVGARAEEANARTALGTALANSAAGARPSGCPARRWSSPPPTRRRSTCPWPRAALELGLGDLERAREQVAEAVPLVEANPRHAVPLYALGLRIEADRAELARARRSGGPIADDGTAAALLERLGQAAASPDGAALPDVACWHVTALAERDRYEGRAGPDAWAAAESLRRAAAITAGLGARPLDAEVKALAQRARLRLDPDASPPATVAPTPAEHLGSPRARPRCWPWSPPSPTASASTEGLPFIARSP